MKARLILTTWDGQGIEVEFGKEPVTLGRDDSNEVSITDEMLSAHHAEIRPVKDGFYLCDLDSTNGTSVNGVEASCMRLVPGDRVVFGKSVFGIFLEMENALPAAAAIEEARLLASTMGVGQTVDLATRQELLMGEQRRVEDRLRERRVALQKLSQEVHEKRGELDRFAVSLDRVEKEFQGRSEALEKVSKTAEKARQSLAAQEREAERKLRELRQKVESSQEHLREVQKSMRSAEGELQKTLAQSGQSQRDLIQVTNTLAKRRADLDKLIKELRLRSEQLDDEPMLA